ncbi:hypothetical protein [Streptomyces sp. NPDC056682]|uniref:hypothetical protein n=1 Tax=Streptomyces sp. NPDC056682 TaxID=3345909 RepID=UPI0036B4A654
MSVVVEFFVAPGDGAVVGVGPRHRGHGFPAFGCADFYPDDAVEDWEDLLTGHAVSESRVVVPMRNDGFMVFQVPEGLCAVLARASRARLVETAKAWIERAVARSDELPVGRAVQILEQVADLARTAMTARQFLYCWYFEP